MYKKLILYKNEYFYKGKKYSSLEINKLLPKLGKSLKIIILGDSILINTFQYTTENFEKSFNEVMNRPELNDANILVHYSINKKMKKLYVYSLKQGININNLSKNINHLKVIPIQFYLKTKFNIYLLLNKKVLIILNIGEEVYSNYFEDGYLSSSNIIDHNEIYKEIKIAGPDSLIYIDKSLFSMISKSDFNNYNIKSIKLGRSINEALFRK